MKEEKNILYRENLKDKISYDKVTGEYTFDNKSENVEIKKIISPISVCWMIENKCNLDCIYCFAEHKNLNCDFSNYKNTIKNILKFHPITIILTGGEPTLNNKLIDILKEINMQAVTIIDSNGTYMSFSKLIPYLNNSVVRFSIDSLDANVIEKVRPSKVLKNTISQIPLIRDNIQNLVSNNIPVIIQTVMTKYNVNEIKNMHDFLVENGVKRWYISAVKYSEKCKDDYEKIGLSENEVLEINSQIKEYSDINVTFSLEEDAGAKSRLFVEKSGKFFVDTIVNGIEYVGENPYCPTKEEIEQKLNCDKHYDLYIKKKNLVRNRNK